MTESLINQLLSIVFALIAAHHSFLALNCCDKNTILRVRLALILTFTGSVGVVLFLLMGNVPHWSLTIFIMATAFRLVSERRKLRENRQPTREEHIPATHK